MKITDIRCHVMQVPEPTGKATLRNWIFVVVHTDEGVTGIGEATTEYHELAVKAQVESELRPRLLGMDPTNVERIWQLCHRDFWWRRGVVHTSALSGLDQALWDIAGKATGQPVFKLLGGAVRDRIRCYIRYGPEFHGRSLEEAVHASNSMGFDAFKLGFGKPTEPYDMQKQADVALKGHQIARNILGPDRALMIDAAGMFDVPAAVQLMRGLEPLNMLFLEEMTNMDTVEPTLRLKQAFPGARIALGERLMTRWDFKPWFEQQVIDVCQADICHTGGISELMKIAHYAEVYGVTIAPHNPYGPVAMAACAHAAAAMQNFLILEHCPIQPWFDRVQKVAVPIVNGYVPVSELAKRPGLGVELDMELVTREQPFVPMAGRRYEQADGSTPML